MAASGTFGEGRVCVGEIGAARGLRGEFRLRSFTADPRAIAGYGALTTERGERSLHLSIVGEAKDVLIARAAGVDDRTAAEALRGCRLYVARADLPACEEDEYYHADLIGLAAAFVAEDGTSVAPTGRVVAVHDHGGGPILEIVRDNAAAALVPFTRAAVPEIDLAAGRLTVAALPGLLAPVEDEDARR
ncbi:MAG: ribosome maturation factor RimM [Rhodospirillales bacterium]|nr:ribosome maturation factor RimM [Rhodospirillales bacterium]